MCSFHQDRGSLKNDIRHDRQVTIDDLNLYLHYELTVVAVIDEKKNQQKVQQLQGMFDTII